ncbi:hypothetical protein COV14_04915 [Candidatus Woesearchaeota archaeon CG10_big_fil_rev_8_21_14_0_10_33_12]|nr:MAG: hypothetical protein COV14_04915 [Candidatus Woesearchaeota archaeon CG10_big_fil_rev_8_21_14_0_10_33_12]
MQKEVKSSVKKGLEQKKETVNLTKQLIQNNIALQSKIVDLISSINNLAKDVKNLVGLFEGAAKQVKEVKTTDEEIIALSAKLNSLLEQNKNIAKGLILLEQYVRTKTGLERIPPKPLTEYKY